MRPTATLCVPLNTVVTLGGGLSFKHMRRRRRNLSHFNSHVSSERKSRIRVLLKLPRRGWVWSVILSTSTMLMSTHIRHIGTWHFDWLHWLRYLTFNVGNHCVHLVPMSTCIAHRMLRLALGLGCLACRLTCRTSICINLFHMLSCSLGTVVCLLCGLLSRLHGL